VKRSYDVGDLSEARVDLITSLDQGGQPTLWRQAAHDDQVIQWLSPTSDDVDHTEVHVRGQTPVQLDFPVAIRKSGLARGEVEKPGRDRLSQFIDAITNEEQQ
jgi:hypothetical protein